MAEISTVETGMGIVKAIVSFRGEHSWLSNFSYSAISEDDIIYPTVEHYFQAQKGLTRMEREGVAQAASPVLAKRAGRSISLRPDWDAVKLQVMRQGLRLKFRATLPLAGKLVATGDALLVEENQWGDHFWGTVNGFGENWLGHLLMARRAELNGS